jgi:S1-C subfamily serine protease
MSEQNKSVLASFSEELAGAVEKAGRSVVAVHGGRRTASSGILWQRGAVVTADHTLEREDEIFVTLPNGQRVQAWLAGRDPGSDVAVLTLAGDPLEPAEIVTSDGPKVGNFVLALGRPGAAPMASFGIVSALGGAWRTARGALVSGFIQADVALYPGFSGGPLIDVQGRVVGMNSSLLARFLGRGQAAALPAAALSNLVQALLTQGRVRRAFLGITSQPVQLPRDFSERLGRSQETGLMLLRVEPESPAEKGGLLMGDILVSIDGRVVSDAEELQATLEPGLIGRAVDIVVLRGGEPKTLRVTPSERV